MKSTRKSLVFSALSLVLCIAMLIGTTYAWFTDSVTSGKNVIQAGNLDIELEYYNGSAWNSVGTSTKLFNDGALWEPGHTEVAYLKLSNVGTLALKYNFAINVAKEVAGTNVAGESFKLSDYIKMGVIDGTSEKIYEKREDARAAATSADPIASFSKGGEMVKGAAPVYVTIVAFMPEDVGNVANYKTGTTPPSIELGVNVNATQLVNENDSFGNDYDETTPWMGGYAAVPAAVDNVITIKTAEELAGFARAVNGGTDYAGKTITLANDIDLNNVEWTQINGAGHNITFDGNNKTIKGLKITKGHNAGFFATGSGCTIKNLNFDGASVTAVGRGAVVCGHGMCVTVDKCKVLNSSVTAVVTNNDDGDKAGAIVGYLSGEPNAKVTNCTVEGCTVTGYRDIGGLVGNAGGTYTVTGNTVKNTTVINDRTNDYKGYGTDDAKYDIHEIIGEEGTSGTRSDNTSTNVTISKIAPIVVPAGQTAQEAVTNTVSAAKDGDTIVIPSSNETITLPSIPANITIKGDGNTKIVLANDVYGASAAAITKGATLEKVILDCGDSLYHGFHHSGPIEFKDCKINGKLTLYGPTVFTNCTINTTTASGADYIWTYGCNVTFDGCTFNTLGKAILCYNEMNGSGYNNVTVKNCTFNATAGAKAGAIANQNCAAIEIDNYGCGVNLKLEGNTVQKGDNAFSGEWRIKNYCPESANDKIFVNGVEYTSIAIDGKTMTIDGSKNVTVND